MVCAALTDSNRLSRVLEYTLDQARRKPAGRFFALIPGADGGNLLAADACTFCWFGRSVDLNFPAF